MWESSAFFKSFFTVWTALSASPLLCGYRGELIMWVNRYSLCKLPKFCASKLRAIVRNHHFQYAMCGENAFCCLDGCGSSFSLHETNISPSGQIVHCNDILLSM